MRGTSPHGNSVGGPTPVEICISRQSFREARPLIDGLAWRNLGVVRILATKEALDQRRLERLVHEVSMI